MIDNYDSFTYNIVSYLRILKEEVIVKKNDEINLEEIKQLNPEIIVISPGPKTPNESNACCASSISKRNSCFKAMASSI